MIELHRIGHTHEPFSLNPSLVVSIEAHPDTTLLLATGTHLVVAEDPERVVELINGWHATVAAAAMKAHVAATREPPEGPTPLRSR
ncbi:MAG: flagellar FlbD family protein [Solirubrobacteraceae bacterium]|nr:flagellar FlbD family protein [Solirubrobacteraceae bacterium]